MPASVESILYANYIKYDRLFEMTMHAFYGRPDPGDNIDIYIDMNSMLKSLYRWINNDTSNIVFDKENVITSSMINLVAHLRHYFITRHKVYTRFYLVYGDNFPNNPRQLIPSYNQTAYGDYVTKIQITDKIRESISVINILAPYIPDMYFVYDTEVETAVLIKAIMEFNMLNNPESNKIPKIIYSKDPYCYQLVSMEPYTFLYRPKKIRDQDVSWVTPKSILYENYAIGESKYVIEPNTPYVDVQSLSLVMAMSGLKARNVHGVMRFSTAMKVLDKAFKDLLITPGYNVAFELGLDQIISEKEKISEISKNFKAIDLWYNFESYKYEKGILPLQRFMLNLHDPEAIKDINDKYFRDNPIDIMAL